eukprot:7876742-Karenia_brevis.AAC.1
MVNSLALAGGIRGLWFMSSVPRAAALRRIVAVALESYLPKLVAEIQKSVHVYSGSAIKHDGHYDIASRIVTVGKDSSGRWKLTRPFSVIHGFTGIDGALLEPVFPGRTEDWVDIKARLDKLVDAMIEN